MLMGMKVRFLCDVTTIGWGMGGGRVGQRGGKLWTKNIIIQSESNLKDEVNVDLL